MRDLIWVRDGLARGSVIVCLLLLSLSLGCRSAPRPEPRRVGWTQEGLASWYGYPFHGRQTASGEVYDMYAMTAAHRTLPFGTVVEVRDTLSGRRVTVRINDRGPFVRGRIIDLSYGAAVALGVENDGVVPVEITVVANPRRKSEVPTASQRYAVQIGAFRDRSRALSVVDELSHSFPSAHVETVGPIHRVRLGPFSDRRAAQRMLRRLRRDGREAYVVEL